MSPATKRIVRGCLCAGVMSAIGCSGSPTSPGSSPVVSGLAIASSPRSGELHVTKSCVGTYNLQAGDFCTITSSNVAAIEDGSKVIYASAANPATLTLDTDVVLDAPGPGNNKAFGHCALNLVTGVGLCTFSGGTGKFTSFSASARISPPADGVNWHWDGTYSFIPRD